MRIFISLVVLWAMSLPVLAQERPFQQVISQQIEALQRDDFEQAYGFAAPNIRVLFQTPDHFAVMVKHGYPMIYRPKSVRFMGVKENGAVVRQNVLVQDQAGQFFTAEYSLVETQLGWKIQGVQLINPDLQGT